jgi:hypothetical protein
MPHTRQLNVTHDRMKVATADLAIDFDPNDLFI